MPHFFVLIHYVYYDSATDGVIILLLRSALCTI